MSADTQAPAAPAKKSKKNLVLILVAGLLLAGGSAGAAWYVAQRGKPAGTAAAHVPEVKPVHKPVFAPLEVFTVNLQDGRGERYAQIGMTLQLENQAAEELLKDRLPAVRNEILLLIASKHIDELLTNDGKLALAGQVRARAAQVMALAPGATLPPVSAAQAAGSAASAPAHGASAPAVPVAQAASTLVQDVLFSQFIVQ